MQILPFEKRLLALKIIHGALMMGLTLFGAIVLSLHFSKAPATGSTGGAAAPDVFTPINLGLFVIMLFVGSFMQRVAVRNGLARQPEGLDEQAFEAAMFPVIQTGNIMRLALLEGPAMFSLVIILISTNRLVSDPTYWINIVPAVAAIVIMALLFPSTARYTMKVKELFADYSARR